LLFEGNPIDRSGSTTSGAGGIFVARSLEGVGATAIAISNVLRNRRATVVIYDYCLSACASYFFFASVRTYVLKGALVAWHNAASGFPDCTFPKRPRDEGPKKLQRAPCNDVPPEYLAGYSAFLAARANFYSSRAIDPDFEFPPDSVHVRRILISLYGETGIYPDVAWTWNPRYLSRTLKAKIHYEAYPVDQEEVNRMVARLGVRKVIYDP
jgi:hypothetical protein